MMKTMMAMLVGLVIGAMATVPAQERVATMPTPESVIEALKGPPVREEPTVDDPDPASLGIEDVLARYRRMIATGEAAATTTHTAQTQPSSKTTARTTTSPVADVVNVPGGVPSPEATSGAEPSSTLTADTLDTLWTVLLAILDRLYALVQGEDQ